MSGKDSSHNEIKGQKGQYLLNSRPFSFGSASILWQATDNTGNIVCVKSFQKGYGIPRTKQFINELVARQTMAHPHILPILDHGHENSSQETDNPFIVLPFCTGGNLRELMRGRDFVSPQLFFPILQQIAQAVDFAHANGVIHGDIKPENILFRDEARQHAWLADFGISIFFPVSEQIVTKEAPGAGSTAYLSPEQIGNNRQSPASDIYAMAMVAYEALTGRLPFDITAPPYKQMYAKVNGDLVNPLTANGRLTQTISDGLLAGLNIDPLKRPRTGVEFFELLQEKVSNSDNSTKAQGALLARDYGRNELLRLHKILCERFDEAELRTLCFEIGQVDYDELSGSGKNVKARELISYLVRRNRIDDLVAVGQQIRSDIEWIEDKHESS